MYELYVVVGKPVGADGESHVQTEQIIGGYIKDLRQLHQRLCGGNGNAHLPGVHARARHPKHFGKLRLCIALLLAELFYSFVNHERLPEYTINRHSVW